MSTEFESATRAVSPTQSVPVLPKTPETKKFIQDSITSGKYNKWAGMDLPSTPSNEPSYKFAHTFNTPNGPMTFIPESFVNSGMKVPSQGKTWVNTWFQNQDNLNKFSGATSYVDLSGLDDPEKRGFATKGFAFPGYLGDLIPDASSTLYSFDESKTGGITGLAKLPNGQVGYATGNGGYVSVPSPGTRVNGYMYISGYGMIPAGYTTYDGKTPYVYTPPKQAEQSNNFFDKVAQNMGPIVKLAAIVTGDPSLLFFSAGKDVMDGNYIGAAMSVAGAYGNTPGVDAETAEVARNVSAGLQIANAIKTDNPIGALTALSGMTGTGLPSEFMKATQLIAVNNAIQKKDLAALAVAVGGIAGNKDLQYAGKAANLLSAIQTGDIAKITKSLYGFIPELQAGYKAGDISAIFDKMGYSLGDSEKQLLESGMSLSPAELTKTITGFTPDELAPEPLTSEQAEDLYQQAAKDAGFPDLQTQLNWNNDAAGYKQWQDEQRQKAITDEYTRNLYAQNNDSTPTPTAPVPQQESKPTQEKPSHQSFFNSLAEKYGPEQAVQIYTSTVGYGDLSDVVKGYLHPPAPVTPAPVEPTPVTPTPPEPLVPEIADDGTTGDIQDIINVLNPTTPEPVAPETPPAQTQQEEQPPTDYKSVLDYFVGQYGQDRGFRMFSDYMTANGLGNPNDYISQPDVGITDDGTTGGIQDIINVINPTEPPPIEPPPVVPPPVEPPPVQPPVQPDTTGGGSLGDESDTDVNLEGGDLGMTEDEWQTQFYAQIGIDPATLSSLPPAEQSEIGAILGLGQKATSAQIARAKSIASAAKTLVKPPVTPPVKPPTTPTTPVTPNVTAAPATPALSSNNLLALLALDNQPAQQQQVQPTPLADIKYYYDFNNDIGNNIFAGDMVPQKPQNTQGPAMFSFFDGGEVDDLSADDLIQMLKGD